MKRFSMIFAVLGLLSSGITKADMAVERVDSLNLEETVQYASLWDKVKSLGGGVKEQIQEKGEQAFQAFSKKAAEGALVALSKLPGGDELVKLAEELQQMNCTVTVAAQILRSAFDSFTTGLSIYTSAGRQSAIERGKQFVALVRKRGIIAAVSILGQFGYRGLYAGTLPGLGWLMAKLAKDAQVLTQCKIPAATKRVAGRVQRAGPQLED